MINRRTLSFAIFLAWIAGTAAVAVVAPHETVTVAALGGLAFILATINAIVGSSAETEVTA